MDTVQVPVLPQWQTLFVCITFFSLPFVHSVLYFTVLGISVMWVAKSPITSPVTLLTHVEQLNTHLVYLWEPDGNIQSTQMTL